MSISTGGVMVLNDVELPLSLGSFGKSGLLFDFLNPQRKLFFFVNGGAGIRDCGSSLMGCQFPLTGGEDEGMYVVCRDSLLTRVRPGEDGLENAYFPRLSFRTEASVS